MIKKDSDAGALNYFYSSCISFYIKEVRTSNVQVEFDLGIHLYIILIGFHV